MCNVATSITTKITTSIKKKEKNRETDKKTIILLPVNLHKSCFYCVLV